MKLRLRIDAPPHWEGTMVPVGCTPYLVGQDGRCQLRFRSPSIGSRHCAVVVRDHRVFIQKLAAPLAVRVNDQPIESEQEVHHGDRVQLGHLSFAIEIEPSTVPPHTDAPTLSPADTDDETVAALLLAMDKQEEFQSPRAKPEMPVDSPAGPLPHPQAPARSMTPKAHPDRDENIDTGALAGDLLQRLSKKAATDRELAKRKAHR
jgi:pSer/pThr/pTyr-binding forkhead associated (FHA) protein